MAADGVCSDNRVLRCVFGVTRGVCVRLCARAELPFRAGLGRRAPGYRVPGLT
jgi:hypothetical protein